MPETAAIPVRDHEPVPEDTVTTDSGIGAPSVRRTRPLTTGLLPYATVREWPVSRPAAGAQPGGGGGGWSGCQPRQPCSGPAPRSYRFQTTSVPRRADKEMRAGWSDTAARPEAKGPGTVF